ncbi:hypothetical protein VNI00_017840 [Paramarasmius palmivorus]|uniref:Uncharacterized protein n=1 Tax=Paramarasmius palmivorus TaxID=297713 RepID=A0AAW0B4A6_9AGAR
MVSITTCVPLAALAKQNTKFSKGLRYTGVGGVCCGRSDMFVKLGNLHKGERYRNMDYILGVAMRDFMTLLAALLVYDIACQWFIHLYERVANWPKEIDFPSSKSMKVRPAIGKLHEPGHKQGGDHQQYNLNLIEGSGHTDGESMERLWGEHNNLGNATKTMGPGSREDYIDSHVGSWNNDKYISMGQTLARRRKDAIKDRNLQTTAHEQLTANLPKELVAKWEAMCVEWEAAPHPKKDVANPYHIEEEFISEQQALDELSLEEENRLKMGGSQYHSVSAASFIVMGLEIRDTQTKLVQRLEVQKREGTVKQSRKLTDERNALRRRLRAFQEIQPIYMPGLSQHLTDAKPTEYDSEEHPEHTKLWLPSQLPGDRVDVICSPGLRNAEAKLQHARCHDSLHSIRHTLRVKTRMMLFKNTNVRGQRQSGKSREVINRVVRRAKWYAWRDREARQAYHVLAGPGKWERSLKPLRNEDIRSYRDPAMVKARNGRKGTTEEDAQEREQLERFQEVCSREDEERDDHDDEQNDNDIDLIHPDRQDLEHRSVFGTGETRKELSWIWLSGGKIDLEDGADENNNEILRTEWCKSRARARRAKEEVLLVNEEMRRTLEYLDWRAREWEACADVEMGRGSAEVEGSRAFALAQAKLQRALKGAFEMEWKKPLEAVERSEQKEVGEMVGDDVDAGDRLPGSVLDDESEEEEQDEGDGVFDDFNVGTDGDGTDGDDSEAGQWDPEVDGF